MKNMIYKSEPLTIRLEYYDKARDPLFIFRDEYKRDYGNSEIISRMFKCEICGKEVKHTRNIIGKKILLPYILV